MSTERDQWIIDQCGPGLSANAPGTCASCAQCIREATKAGLCGSHYMAWYRHRQANGIDTRKDFAA